MFSALPYVKISHLVLTRRNIDLPKQTICYPSVKTMLQQALCRHQFPFKRSRSKMKIVFITRLFFIKNVNIKISKNILRSLVHMTILFYVVQFILCTFVNINVQQTQNTLFRLIQIESFPINSDAVDLKRLQFGTQRSPLRQVRLLIYKSTSINISFYFIYQSQTIYHPFQF